MLRLKNDPPDHRVRLHPDLAMFIANRIVEQTYDKYGYDCEITSSVDGDHMVGSFHPKGKALDYKTNHVSTVIMLKIAAEVRGKLGPDFDVLFGDPNHKNHMHVEFDPKGV